VASRLGEVSPVRAPHRVADRETEYRQGAEFAAKGQGEQQARAQVQRTGPISVVENVVELPVADQGRVQLSAPRQKAQPFVPFLAQQIAQEGMPDGTPDADRRRRHEAVSEAYVMASDDATNILGPVRPRQLVV
jgi:hypothetical protein